MLQDLEAVAPSVIVCAVFLVGVVALLRHEMAPRRKGRGRRHQSERSEGARRER
ncbi:MAG: hypothetical protein J2P25_17890 [Nocardiopsaceae bacterium]|nr:hypothetical protein [Nocardiopsaceae bacterium]